LFLLDPKVLARFLSKQLNPV